MKLFKIVFLLLFNGITWAFPSLPLHQNKITVTPETQKLPVESLSEIQKLNELYPLVLPHCSKAVVTSSRLSFLNGLLHGSSGDKLHVGVGQTICFQSKDENENSTSPELHTLTLTRLEQYHPITEHYHFAIPEVDTRCICDCSSKSSVCNANEYSFGSCGSSSEKNTACYRTFFDSQPTIGCPEGNSEPKLCCELKFRPYRNRTYTALKLDKPSTFAVLRYATFRWDSGRWTEGERRTISFHVDGSMQSQFMDSKANFDLTVTSREKSNNHLEAGMYFVENLENGQYGEMIEQPLNAYDDHNFERLGWFREDSPGEFSVKNGNIMMDKIHRAKAENCMDQKYQSILVANYYINSDAEDSTKFRISEILSETHKWIKSAKVTDSGKRHVKVIENEKSDLEIILRSNLNEKLRFIHNASVVEDFVATIVIDKYSNSMLNITVINANGIINGYITKIGDHQAEHIDSFTLYIPESKPSTKQLITRIKPYPPNTVRMVCLRPDEGPLSSQICRVVESKQHDLAVNEIDTEWIIRNSKCPECNQINVHGFMKYLNPAAWIGGINSINDFVMMITDVFVYFCVFLVFYCCISKIVFPLIKYCLCPTAFCFSRHKK